MPPIATTAPAPTTRTTSDDGPTGAVLAACALTALGVITVIAGNALGHGRDVNGSLLDAWWPTALGVSTAIVTGWRARLRRLGRRAPQGAATRALRNAVACTAPVALVGGAVLVATGAWPVGAAEAFLSWLVSAAFLIGWGVLWAALTARAWPGVVAVLAAAAAMEGLAGVFRTWLWGRELYLFVASRFSPAVTDWAVNRVVVGLIAVGVALLAHAAVQLRRPARR